MDAFRRFRSRKKSKGQSDAFTSFADAESTYRSGNSPWQTSTVRSSTTFTRPSDVTAEPKISYDQAGLTKASMEQQPPGSSGRVQPVLIGISKPFLGSSRPGTAESMQNALDRAAESVKYQQLQRNTSSPTSQLGVRAGRYIDIFAISGQTHGSMKTFNEDVASRNLEIVPTTLEEHIPYEPSSKYQEEVATRNAHQIAAQRASSLRQPTIVDRVKPSDLRSASAQSGSYIHQHSNTGSVRSRTGQNMPTHHTRHGSSRPREPPDYLPAIPQERSSQDIGRQENRGHEVRQAEQDLEKSRAKLLETRRQNQIDQPYDIEKPLPASPLRKEPMRDSGVSSYTSSANRMSEVSDLQQQRGSRHESIRSGTFASGRGNTQAAHYMPPNTASPRSDRYIASRPVYDRASDSSRRVEKPGSSHSGQPGYRRVLVGNRTIMDLTGEEEVEAGSVASYMATPIIEDARADFFQKVTPTAVNHSPQRAPERDSVVPNSRWSSAQEPVLDLDQLARRSQAIADTTKALTASSRHPTTETKQRPVETPVSALAFSPIQTLTSSSPPYKIMFSPVNTLSSISPRSSSEISAARKEDTTPALQVVSPGHINSSKLLGPQSEKISKPSTRISANIEPLVKVFADVRPEEVKEDRKPISSQLEAPHNNLKVPKIAKSVTSSSKKEGKKRETSEEAEAIRTAAKSIIPAGPLDQEPLPGVTTRDFAVLPAVKPTNKRIEALSERKKVSSEKNSSKEQSSSSKSSSSERKGRSRSSKSANKVAFNETPVSSAPSTTKTEKSERKSSKKSSKKTSASSRKDRPKSMFDEEAFKKKHAEANAALLRLQQSLQEDLDEDSSELPTPRETTISAERAWSPANSVARGATPVTQASPSAAAIAMITAATSPRNPVRPKMDAKANSNIGQRLREVKPNPYNRSSNEGTSSFKQPSLNTATAISLSPHLSHLDPSNKPPPSPGEVSLSAFPIPTPRARSPESTKSPPAYVKDVGAPVRRGSQASRMSSASAFSIPFTMVPSRMASLPENRMGIPGPPTASHMDSIDSIIPTTQSLAVTSP